MRSPHDHGLTDGARHGHDRRRLFLLLAPVVVLFIANVIGIAFAPMLLGRAPLVLIALSPLVRHLVLASSSVDAVPFFGPRFLRWATPEEHASTIAESAIFIVLGLLLVVIGLAIDNRYSLV